MTYQALVLILISAFIHAGWNLLSKKSEPSVAFFFLANSLGSLVLLLPLAIWSYDYLVYFSLQTVLLSAAAGFMLAIYYVGIAKAYQTGQLSIAYPMARSFPVILVALASLLAGFSQVLSISFLTGALLIVIGSFLLPAQQFNEIKFSQYLQPSMKFAFLAALGTAGYSLIDAKALGDIASETKIENMPWVSILYSLAQVWFCSLWMGVSLFLFKSQRQKIKYLLYTQGKKSGDCRLWNTPCVYLDSGQYFSGRRYQLCRCRKAGQHSYWRSDGNLYIKRICICTENTRRDDDVSGSDQCFVTLGSRTFQTGT